ncbi:6-phosphogluconolactonase [Thalassotalea ponticola]|uniref:6-phosphogluconolactonase n=1 Tax=Thalassotalea ponticola TaxID=1523392 RepID=UPI0025B5AD32|nr:6-phosphogluconolactonase [Thalassotalea ponticola]MDN3651532.1 6-phosphogluconolactonase [Thalassotalea ponticola]
MINKQTFPSRQALDAAFAKQVASQLTSAIEKRGKATIAFSGGSTPKGFFEQLSLQPIEWQKVTVTLADDRWVDTEHSDSNDRLLRENLLTNNAAQATLFSLVENGPFTPAVLEQKNTELNSVLPLDIVILGMGEDGHTASIFPCSEQVEQGLDNSNAPALMLVEPTTAPYQRITFNFPALIAAQHLYLHIVGENKLTVLDKALDNEDAMTMPIRAFLHHPDKTIDVIWAE